MGTQLATDGLSRHLFTVDDYYKMASCGILHEDSHIELINGELIEMSPIGSEHAEYVDQLNYLLIGQLKEQYRIRVQNPIRLDRYNEPEPDIVIVKNQSYLKNHPQASDIHLIIEVAGSSLLYDQNTKIPLYARNLIPEVWLLNLPNRLIEVYSNPDKENNNYKNIKIIRSGPISPERIPELFINTDKLLHAL